MCAQLPGAR